MQVYAGLIDALKHQPIEHLAIGFFDGLHRGHHEVICNSQNRDNLEKTCVLTFWPHPQSILNPDFAPVMITDLDEKYELLTRWGIGHVCVIEFTPSLAGCEPQWFLDQMATFFPNLKHLSIGPNFRFGKNRSGNPLHLSKWCQEHDIQFNLADFILKDGAPISSTRIRDLLASGNLKLANQLLGRNYTITGRVIPGEGLGRKIGFPTANLKLRKPCALPLGVYSAQVHVAGHLRNTARAAINIGIRPTVAVPSSKQNPSFEVHLINWSENLYDQTLTCDMDAFIRPEKVFDSLEKLKEQIAKDIRSITPPSGNNPTAN